MTLNLEEKVQNKHIWFYQAVKTYLLQTQSDNVTKNLFSLEMLLGNSQCLLH